jgi:hypothetical protein
MEPTIKTCDGIYKSESKPFDPQWPTFWLELLNVCSACALILTGMMTVVAIGEIGIGMYTVDTTQSLIVLTICLTILVIMTHTACKNLGVTPLTSGEA